MRRRLLRCFSALLFLCLIIPQPSDAQERGAPARPAELVLVNAKVWTVEADQPTAQAVAIRGQRIIKVGSYADMRPVIREDYTRILDLRGKLVLPGFIDNHVHFASAGRLLLGLNLLDINDAEPFRQRVAEAARRLPAGIWLTGGDWGAYAQWAQGSTGAASGAEAKEFHPDRN